jgi:hypothetical protein
MTCQIRIKLFATCSLLFTTGSVGNIALISVRQDPAIYIDLKCVQDDEVTKREFTIQINHQPEATVFQFIILTFIYSSICFGRSLARHQELSDCSSSLWFYLRIVVTVVLCS